MTSRELKCVGKRIQQHLLLLKQIIPDNVFAFFSKAKNPNILIIVLLVCWDSSIGYFTSLYFLLSYILTYISECFIVMSIEI